MLRNAVVRGIVLAMAMAIGVAGCATGGADYAPATQSQPVAESPGDVQPLTVGEQAPAATLRGVNDDIADLRYVYAQQPTALIFYRGGWCPYCNAHLSEVGEAEAELIELGFGVVAISPDQPAKLQETLDEQPLNYRLLSDSNMELSRAFGLAFRVDDETIERYREFEIDLEEASGQSHHLLPVPAVYLIDREGVIRFAYWEADHRERLSGQELIEAAEAVVDDASPAAAR